MASEPPRDRTLTHTAVGNAGDGVEAEFMLPARWRLARLLGHGGQAEVWLAHDGELDEWVAVKVFHPDLTDASLERLRREVRLGRSLQHPNLVRMFELIEADDRLAVVMEHVPGGNLAQRVSGRQLPIAEVVRFTGEALAALEFLHGQGVVHRDVKPSNLLLDAEGRVRLADFGLVRRLEGDADLTRTSMTVGTPFYMSPEQVRGARAGFPADLYGLGVTVYELLAGRAPFTGSSQLEVASQHLQVTPPDVRRARPDCPRWLARFVHRLLEKRPEDRWPDAAAARRVFMRRRVFASPRTWRRAAVGAAAAIALIAAAIAVFPWAAEGPASVAVSGDGVAALDARGRELWRRRLPAPRVAVTASIFSERSHEVAVVTVPDAEGAAPESADIVVFDASGAERARVSSVPDSLLSFFPDITPRMFTGRLVALDLDGDRRQELAWLSSHVRWYPSLLGVWRLEGGTERTAVFFNSGTLHHVLAADVDGDGGAELVLAGLNNPLGFQSVLIIVDLPHSTAYGPISAPSPDLVTQWLEYRANGERVVRAYVPFPRVGVNSGTLSVEGGQIAFGSEERTVRFDLDGNPEGSPLFGRGPEPRSTYWDELARLCRTIELGTASSAEVDTLFARHAEILDEEPTRLGAELLIARSLALAGHHEEAVARLGVARQRMPGERDLQLRLAEQLAIGGRVAESVEILRSLIATRESGRGNLDPIVALALLGALGGTDEFVATADRAWREIHAGTASAEVGLDLAAHFAFCRGDFDARVLDGTGRSSGLVPTADVVHRWALLERGASPAEIARRAAGLAENPEARWAARALEARALARSGEARRAADVAIAAVNALETPARVGLEARLWLAVASRVAADALTEAGDHERAAGHAARARQLAPRCWFGSEVGRPRLGGASTHDSRPVLRPW